MKNIFKKVSLLLLVSFLVISFLSSATYAIENTGAKDLKQDISKTKNIEKIYNIGQYKEIGDYLYNYFNNLYKILETGNISNFKQSSSDINTYIIIKDLEYKSNLYNIFHNGIKDISVDQFIIKEVKENTDDIDVIVYVNVSYVFNKNENSSMGALYKVKLRKGNNDVAVIGIDTTSIDIQIVKDTIKAKMSSINNSINGNLEELKIVDDLYSKRNEKLPEEKQKADNAAKLNTSLNLGNVVVNSSSLSTTSVNVSYTASDSRYYGWWFGDHYENYIFKRASLDCTNFASQCIWSGYGGCSGYDISDIGYDSSYYNNSTAQALRARVANNYRQTSQWYGRNYDSPYGDPITNFCSVSNLWNYATSNTGNGPKADGYNNNSVYTNLSTPMKQGDILQFYNPDTQTWYHSVIVVTTTDYTVSQYTNVRVAQHESEYYWRPLDELIQYFGGSTCKMRLLRPKSTTFAS
ncbi:MAG: amidase domain-containing protein [Minisyncoccia bacterium]